MVTEKKRIELGLVYSARVGGAYMAVRADKSLGHGRYEGTTVRPDGTGSTVRFATDAVRGDGMTDAAWREKHTPKTNDLPVPAAGETAPTAKGKTARKAKGTPNERKPSGLDSAVVVLAEAGKPMNTADIVARLVETGLWKTKGKTPSATIYAAIIREIASKGAESRFRKTDRGHFELTEVGKGVK